MPPPNPVIALLEPMLITGLSEILRSPDNSVLDRVVVNIIEVPLKVIFVSNNVIPKAKLPDSDIDLDLVEFLILTGEVVLQ